MLVKNRKKTAKLLSQGQNGHRAQVQMQKKKNTPVK